MKLALLFAATTAGALRLGVKPALPRLAARLMNPPSLAINDAVLFEDGLELKRSDTPYLRRPGRGEGLADELADSLCLFDGMNVSAADLRQGELGNCWLISATEGAEYAKGFVLALKAGTSGTATAQQNVRQGTTSRAFRVPPPADGGLGAVQAAAGNDGPRR